MKAVRCAPRIIGYSLLALLHAPAGLADTPRELIQRGNAYYDAGQYAEALEAYEQAGRELGDAASAELLHDQAAAYFKLGQLDEARELWVRAATLADAAFEAAARYNLGNCDYADALKAVKARDVQKALELLGRAGEQYRDALRLDPRLANARANLELTEMLKEQIKQQTTTQPQSQPASQPQGDGQQRPQERSSSRPASQPSQRDDQPKQRDQAPASQPSSQPQPRPETQPSPEPQREPEEPQAEESPPASQAIAPPATQPVTEPPPPGSRMTRAQAQRLLQMIRDAEKARRRLLRQRAAARQRPVERDW